MRLVVATRNPDKLAEIRLALTRLPIEVVSLADFPGAPEVVEDGATLEANALKKARSAAQVTGLPAIADDTGLEVEALGGAPGVTSARYAGPKATYEDNWKKLLREMEGKPGRSARFRCVIAVVDPAGKETVIEGRCRGRITLKPRGTRGFGYDPVFEVPSLGKTFAELSPEDKNRISHRGHALARLCDLFRSVPL